MQLNLGELVQRADYIYRGTVISVSSGSVAVGGGQLPVTIYRLRVDETFRGEFTEVKGIRITEIRTLGKLTPVTPATCDRRCACRACRSSSSAGAIS